MQKNKIHIKKNDYVQIISGKYKGIKSQVNQVIHKKSQVIVNGVNIVKKHVKPKNDNESGEIICIEAPIHTSNVKIIDKN